MQVFTKTYQQYMYHLLLLSGFPLSPFSHVSYVFLLVYETQNPYQLHDTGDVCPCEPKPAGCDPPLLISAWVSEALAGTT